MSSAQQSEPIIDAEIVSDDKSDISHSITDKNNVADDKKSGRLSWFGWAVAGAFTVFALGVVFAPQVREQMQILGLAPDPGPTASKEPTTPVDYGPRMDQLAADVAQLQQQLVELASQSPSLDVADVRDLVTPVIREEQAAARADIDKLTSDLAAQRAENASLGALVQQLSADVTAAQRALQTAAEAEKPIDFQPEIAALKADMQVSRDMITQLTEKLIITEQLLAAQRAETAALASGRLSASPRGRLLVALMSLRDRLNSGSPYADVMAIVRADLETLPALDQAAAGAEYAKLMAAQQSGVASFSRLQADYQALLPELETDPAGDSWWSGLVRVRRTDSLAAGRDATLNAVEGFLRSADLAAAVSRLAADIPTEARPDSLKSWLSAAEARLNTLRALDTLTGRITTAADAS